MVLGVITSFFKLYHWCFLRRVKVAWPTRGVNALPKRDFPEKRDYLAFADLKVFRETSDRKDLPDHLDLTETEDLSEAWERRATE